jgi:hypothetical protein
VLFVFGVAVAQLPERIVCAGDYGGHLQGVATDGESIYWSFTVAVVKTDLTGNILVSREAPSHQGDMCYKDGVVYVAVNRGRFNTESRGVSQVTAYDAKTLEPMWTKPLPDMPHGAGGMTWKGDRFYIIGGLPLKHEKNYVYEYTSDFKFVKRHDLDTGFTWMGIQTAAHEDDTFYFGIYGSKGDPSGVLASPDDLSSYTRYTGAGSVGIIKLDGAYYLGGTGRDKKTKRNTGHLVRQKVFPDPKKAFATVEVIVKNTGKKYAGREVVQVYCGAPQGKLGKPKRVLVAYAKTNLLAPDESQTFTFTIPAKDFASFDDGGATGHQAAWVLEPGQ